MTQLTCVFLFRITWCFLFSSNSLKAVQAWQIISGYINLQRTNISLTVWHFSRWISFSDQGGICQFPGGYLKNSSLNSSWRYICFRFGQEMNQLLRVASVAQTFLINARHTDRHADASRLQQLPPYCAAGAQQETGRQCRHWWHGTPWKTGSKREHFTGGSGKGRGKQTQSPANIPS